MKILIRVLKEDDLVPLRNLLGELGYPMEIEQLKTNISAVFQNNGIVFVAEGQGTVVGSVCVIIDARLAEGVNAEIVSIIVSDRLRGKGIGKMLLKEAENWAKIRVPKIRVRANTIRDNAHSFYLKMGFEVVKTQKIFTKKLQNGGAQQD